MNIRDEIRDELYGSLEDESKSESFAAEYDDLLGADGRPYGGQKTFVYCVVTEAIVIGLILLSPSYLRGLIDWFDMLVYGSIITFVIGFVATFIAWRILKNDVFADKDLPVESGVMSGYSGYEQRQRQFTVWFVASAGGAVNTLLLLLLMSIRY